MPGLERMRPGVPGLGFAAADMTAGGAQPKVPGASAFLA